MPRTIPGKMALIATVETGKPANHRIIGKVSVRVPPSESSRRACWLERRSSQASDPSDGLSISENSSFGRKRRHSGYAEGLWLY